MFGGNSINVPAKPLSVLQNHPTMLWMFAFQYNVICTMSNVTHNVDTRNTYEPERTQPF